MAGKLKEIVSVVWSCVPLRLRKTASLQKLRDRTKNWFGDHNSIYDADYYTDRRVCARASAEIIGRTIAAEFQPGQVLDVGCGTGDLMIVLRARGIQTSGLEYSDAALAVCKAAGLDVRKWNLETRSIGTIDGVDTVVCTEVAEHLPEYAADKLVQSLSQNGETLVFTGAPPGQGGTDHVNEQPPEYWIAKFKKRGWSVDEEMTERIKAEWAETVVLPHYWKNLMVFRRR